MKPHERTLHVAGCSTPGHGPEKSCWKVVDEDGGRPIQGVTKDVADLYAAAPSMVRVLLDHMKRHGESMACGCWTCSDTRRVLTSAGVPIR